MSSQKSLIIINQYIGSPYHGMEYRHYYLAKNLVSKGYRVTLVSASYSHLFSTPPKVKSLFTKESIDGIDYIWVKVPRYSSSKSLGRIFNMFYFAFMLRFLKLQKADIMVSSPSLFPIKVAKSLSRKFGSKLLFEIRDIWPLTLVELSNIKESNPLIRLMKSYERFGYTNADRVISLLPCAKEHFIANGMSGDKFRYLPNGIEFSTNINRDLPKEVLSAIPKDKFTIAYSGTIGIANNLDYLIDVAELLRDNENIAFIILGQGGQKDRLMKRVEELGLDSVTFIEPIPKDYVGAFLSQIDVAFISLLPEKIFRFGVSPNKVFDYMYAKKPIIWAIEAGNNLVKEANCGVSVGVDDTLLLKDKILELYNYSDEELKKLGENGYNFVLTKHTYDKLSDRLMEIIDE